MQTCHCQESTCSPCRHHPASWWCRWQKRWWWWWIWRCWRRFWWPIWLSIAAVVDDGWADSGQWRLCQSEHDHGTVVHGRWPQLLPLWFAVSIMCPAFPVFFDCLVNSCIFSENVLYFLYFYCRVQFIMTQYWNVLFYTIGLCINVCQSVLVSFQAHKLFRQFSKCWHCPSIEVKK